MAKRTNDERDALIDALMERVARLEAAGQRDRRTERRAERKIERQAIDPETIATATVKLKAATKLVRGRDGKMVRRVVNPR